MLITAGISSWSKPALSLPLARFKCRPFDPDTVLSVDADADRLGFMTSSTETFVWPGGAAETIQSNRVHRFVC